MAPLRLDLELHLEVTPDVALLYEGHSDVSEEVLQFRLVDPQTGLFVSAEMCFEDSQLSDIFGLVPVLDHVRAAYEYLFGQPFFVLLP